MNEVYDLSAPIVPGKSLGGILLGAPADSLIPHLDILDEETIGKGHIRYEIDSMDIWVKDSVVVQLSAMDDYTGTIDGKVSIGSTIHKTVNTVGPLTENEDGHIIATKSEGVKFSTDNWIEASDSKLNLAVNIIQTLTEIFVFKV
jgi:hypothetical protein